jgi:hypothetical protein
LDEIQTVSIGFGEAVVEAGSELLGVRIDP